MLHSYIMELFKTPKRELLLAVIVIFALIISYFFNIQNNIFVKYFVWISIFVGSLPIVIASFKSLLKLKISIEVFNLFALGVALILDNYIASLWIELMLIFALYLEWRIRSKAKNAVEELIKLSPEIAHKQTFEDTYIDVLPEEIAIGDILLVKNGEKIPVDGEIIFGNASLDESSFTGESIPKDKSIGDLVFAATIITSGVLKIKCLKTCENSVFSSMIKLMKEALTLKSKSHKFADIFATIFLPIVLLVAVIIYVVTKDVVVVAAFLMIVCADDIAVAIPLAMEAAFGKAAKIGVIVKGGIYFEKLANAKVVVFDKTGTLTKSKFKVNNFEISENINIDDFWNIVSTSEKFSEHPIGKAVLRYTTNIINNIEDPIKFKIELGVGVLAKTSFGDVVIGNKNIFNDSIVLINDIYKHRNNGEVELFVSLNNIHIGTIYLSDSIKENAREAIRVLKKMNIRTVMLTGDKEDIAKNVAAELQIDEIHFEMTPESKLTVISELSQENTVVMVGDGVNDAPSLARASVGVAMGEIGMAVSVSAADIIIQNDNLMLIPEIIKLSRNVRKVIIGNFVIWFITNSIGTMLVLTRIAGIPMAAFYNFISDFIPLFNSARLFRNIRK